MQKTPKSFRLSQKAIDELDIILKIESTQAHTLGISPASMTEIIERGINTLYTVLTDQSAGDDYLTRMTSLINNAVQQGMSSHDMAINSILFDLAVVKELLYIQMKVGSYPKDHQIITEILNKKSVYEPIVEEKINERLQP